MEMCCTNGRVKVAFVRLYGSTLWNTVATQQLYFASALFWHRSTTRSTIVNVDHQASGDFRTLHEHEVLCNIPWPSRPLTRPTNTTRTVESRLSLAASCFLFSWLTLILSCVSFQTPSSILPLLFAPVSSAHCIFCIFCFLSMSWRPSLWVSRVSLLDNLLVCTQLCTRKGRLCPVIQLSGRERQKSTWRCGNRGFVSTTVESLSAQ